MPGVILEPSLARRKPGGGSDGRVPMTQEMICPSDKFKCNLVATEAADDDRAQVAENLRDRGDFVTVVTSIQGKRLTKRIYRKEDGTLGVESYDKGGVWYRF